MSSRNDAIRAAVIDSLADDSDDCPVCGSADVSNAAGPVLRSGQWWYRCRGCGFDRFGPAREPVRDGDACPSARPVCGPVDYAAALDR
jgi:ribosomal protein L37AE/L43A